MIHFFRRIRQGLLSQNRFRKYLLYAIGEILLVVIGILIALQINNWNEERKFNSLKKVYIERLIDDLEQDTTQITLLISDLDKRQFIIEAVIKELDSETNNETLVRAIKNYFAYGWNMLDFTPSASTFSDLSQTGNMSVFRNTELTEQIKQYYVTIENGIKGQDINKDWIIPLDVTMSEKTNAFDFDPITSHLFKMEDQKKALQNLLDNKDLFKRNAAGHYWFNNSLKKEVLEIKTLAINLIYALKEELEKN